MEEEEKRKSDFLVMRNDRKNVSGHQLREKFQLNVRKIFLTMTFLEHGLVREVVESPCLEIFKIQPDTALSN